MFVDTREGQCSLNKESKWEDDIKSHWKFKEGQILQAFSDL